MNTSRSREPLSPDQQRQVNKVRDRFEQAWKSAAGPRPRVENYLAEVAEPVRAVLLEELRAMEAALLAAGRDADAIIGPTQARDGQVATTAAAERTLLTGRYELGESIGEGGMGIVCRARDRQLDREVAIKLLKKSESDGRFIHEAKVTGQLQHPGIPPVHELGTLADGRPFLAMKLVKGRTLQELLKERSDPTVDLGRFIGVFEQVCHAVGYAHAHRVIHRDLKPGNIMVGTHGEVQVMDWGLAKVVSDSTGSDRDEDAQEATTMGPATEIGAQPSDGSATRTGSVMGTLAYMAPEQAGGEIRKLDARSDVFGLGAMLCQILTGWPPYEGRNTNDVRIKAVRGEMPEALDRLEKCAAEPELVTLCRQCLAFAPGGRLADGRAVAAAVAGIRAAAEERARKAEVDRERAKVQAAEQAKRRRLARWAAAAVMAMLLAGLAASLWQMDRADRERDAKAEALIAEQKAKKETELEQGRTKNALATALNNEELANKRSVEAADARKKADELAQDLRVALNQEKKAREEIEESQQTLSINTTILAQSRWEQGNVHLANNILFQVPKKYRSAGWKTIQRQLEGSYATLFGHLGPVTSVAFSPDGRYLASASEDCTVKLWDAATGLEIRTFKGHAREVTSVCFSPDGQRLASASKDENVKLWDVATGLEIRTLKGHTSEVMSVTFSPNGQRLASASVHGTPKLWNAATGVEIRTLKEGHTCVTFSPDGERLASASEGGTITLLDAVTGAEIRSLGEPIRRYKGQKSHSVTSVSFSPDGQRLATAKMNGEVVLWDAATGLEIRAFEDHTAAVNSVSFSPDGQLLASASDDRTLRLWDAATGLTVCTLRGHTHEVSSLSFSSDGQRLASASADCTVKLWLAAAGATSRRTLKGHTDGATSVSFSPDGQRLASASNDQTVKLWDAASGLEISTLKGHTGEVKCVSFSPDGKLLASASHDQTVKLWDAASGLEISTLKGHTGEVKCVSFSPDGKRLASADGYGTVMLWDVATGLELRTLKRHDGWVTSVTFSPDGQRLASASADKTVKLWDAATGMEIRTLSGHTDQVGSVTFSPDGQRLASASHDVTVKLWDAASGLEISTLKGHSSLVTSVSFSPDGQRLASASWDRTVSVWDAATGLKIRTLSGSGGRVRSVSFSPDGQRLASASDDKMVRLWDVATGLETRTLTGHTGYVNCVRFSPNGQLLATSSHDTTVKLWDAGTGLEIRTLKGHTGAVTRVTFSPDGQRLASASRDMTAKLWHAATGLEIRSLTGHTNGVWDVSFSPDGRFLASASDKTVKLWDAATGLEVRTLQGNISWVASVSFSADGKIVFGRDQVGKLAAWDLSGKLLDAHPKEACWDQQTALSPDKKWLALPYLSALVFLVECVPPSKKEQSLRRFMAAADYPRHHDEVQKQEAEKNWLAAGFHRSWVVTIQPEVADHWVKLEFACGQLHKQWLTDVGKKDKVQLTRPELLAWKHAVDAFVRVVQEKPKVDLDKVLPSAKDAPGLHLALVLAHHRLGDSGKARDRFERITLFADAGPALSQLRGHVAAELGLEKKND